jgi:hypothetical protein
MKSMFEEGAEIIDFYLECQFLFSSLAFCMRKFNNGILFPFLKNNIHLRNKKLSDSKGNIWDFIDNRNDMWATNGWKFWTIQMTEGYSRKDNPSKKKKEMLQN